MKKGSSGIILVCVCFIFSSCVKDTQNFGYKKEIPISTLQPTASPMSFTTEPLHSGEPQKSDSYVTESPVYEDKFVSESPDKKVRVEFLANATDDGSLNLVDIESNISLISYKFPSDTKFFPVWRDDSSCVALGYKNKTESRTFILITSEASSTTGKQIISHELSYFVNLPHQEDADGQIIPLNFIDNTKLLLSVNWFDKDGKRITNTTEWDFKHGTFTKLKET